MRFMADAMLGTLTKWLRVFGFDTLYSTDMPDDEIFAVAGKESRIIISRDRELCGKVPGSILLEDTDLDTQLAEVLKYHHPDKAKILTRCLECNALLEVAAKNDVAGLIPESVLERHEEFWRCPKCSRIYWQGTHYMNMKRKAERMLHQSES